VGINRGTSPHKNAVVDGRESEMTITTEAAERLASWCGTGLPTIAAALRALAAERDALQAQNARMREALEKLARLGAEPYYGNSDGNMIARAALGETQ
jgi:hypothetical protein